MMQVNSSVPAITTDATPLSSHSIELNAGERFSFGENWHRFLRRLNVQRVKAAEESLLNMLGVRSCEGFSFLDVGSGSGLFSLAARNLGAKVVSFDYDPVSVACTRELKKMFHPDETDWQIAEGSVLDFNFLQTLGHFDVVFSWGVLHHTGAMWTAMENLAPLVNPRGKLFIAIYNDQGTISGFWRIVKRSYNRAPKAFRVFILLPVAVYTFVGLSISDLIARRPLRVFSRQAQVRGMSLWTDIVDWVGGYPFEVATPEQVIDFYLPRGFSLNRLKTCGGKCGCNQFVFTR
jgi:2-polyprenyl-3-methyl-5-hydroxy-6-metoxy-1,4-benzoquinol methylase